MEKYKCSLCNEKYSLRDLDEVSEELEIYTCKSGRGCLKNFKIIGGEGNGEEKDKS